MNFEFVRKLVNSVYVLRPAEEHGTLYRDFICRARARDNHAKAHERPKDKFLGRPACL